MSGVPGLPELRQRLLPLALQFAGLPEGVRQRYTDPASRFNFGWSCGRETLEGGLPDTGKGSFYANPLLDIPTTDPDLLRTYPSYCRPNLWPRGELPQLEAAFKALGALIIQVGLLLTRHCDKYLAARGHPPRLAAILEQSPPCHKGKRDCAGLAGGGGGPVCLPLSWLLHTACLVGMRVAWGHLGNVAAILCQTHSHACLSHCAGRLLHYFAPTAAGADAGAAAGAADRAQNWCGWHYDNGSLTGLTSAMYLDAAGQPAACPDPQAGLHIRDRSGGWAGGWGSISSSSLGARLACSCLPAAPRICCRPGGAGGHPGGPPRLPGWRGHAGGWVAECFVTC